MSVILDGSLSGLGTLGMKAGAAVFFEDIDLSLGVKVSGLVSSIMVELQAIALTLKCVPFSHSVNLFTDSQTALDAYKSESILTHPDFRNWCWIKCHHIADVIYCKNLDVNWVKVRGHSGVLSNKHADVFAKAAVFSNMHLPHIINKHFFMAGDTIVSGNFRHFVCDVFRSIYHVCWEIGSGFWILVDSLCADVDWSRSSSVWHLDFYLTAGFISTQIAGLRTYFIKALHYYLPVAVCKPLYNRSYSSVICLFCSDVKISNHVFFCPFDAAGHA
ncbi:hypothetical protein G9A89_022520 [Geosiphon pyriformis]|nr:hypothetical protein G9A89_022520 [Geosiphon pyriformis]